MSGADMVYETGFGNEILPAGICGIEITNIRMGPEVKGTTDVSLSHVGGADMDLEVS